MVAQITPHHPVASARSAAAKHEAMIDATLVRRFKDGDESAFVEIVMRYREKMRHVALRLLRNHADAEEIAQDTFIRVHRSLAFFRGESSLSAWLHCITLNLARNRYWYFYRRHRHTTKSLDSAISMDSAATFADLIASDTPGPVRETATQEFSDLVAECMNQLKPDQREILILRNVREYSYETIARSMGIKVGTVKSRIGRARRELRQTLNKTYPEFALDVSPFEWLEPARPATRQEIICA